MSLDPITENAICSIKALTMFVQHEVALALASTVHMARGRALPLTARERSNRMRYLAGELPLSALDNAIDKDLDRVLAVPGYADPDGDEQVFCPDGYYLLKRYNGGKDPCAPDPFDRWRKPGSSFTNRTADCASMQWACGADRYQPVRAAHVYKGWLNTDSIILDATGRQLCYRLLDDPEDGCLIVCASGTPGHDIGHMGGVPEGVSGFDRADRRAWAALSVVDIASRGANRANRRTTAAGWFGTGAVFVRPIMA